MGDGSFGFCCGEFETIVRHNMPITSIVFSNATYGWIKAGQDSGFVKTLLQCRFQPNRSRRRRQRIRRSFLDGA